jgi:hypothetical protein
MAKRKRDVKSVRKNKQNNKRLETSPRYETLIALILGVFGVALLASSGMNLTGGVIGTTTGKNLFLCLVGCVSFLASLILFIKKR